MGHYSAAGRTKSVQTFRQLQRATASCVRFTTPSVLGVTTLRRGHQRPLRSYAIATPPSPCNRHPSGRTNGYPVPIRHLAPGHRSSPGRGHHTNGTTTILSQRAGRPFYGLRCTKRRRRCGAQRQPATRSLAGNFVFPHVANGRVDLGGQAEPDVSACDPERHHSLRVGALPPASAVQAPPPPSSSGVRVHVGPSPAAPLAAELRASMLCLPRRCTRRSRPPQHFPGT